MSYNGDSFQIENSRIYVTGEPCYECLNFMIQKRIKEIIYGNVGSKCVDEADLKAKKLTLELNPSVKLIEFKEMDKVIKLLKGTINYIDSKNK